MGSHLVGVADAAEALGLTVSAVEELLDAGYLHSSVDDHLDQAELKAFLARNSANTSASADVLDDAFAELTDLDVGVDEILDALDAAVPDMARRSAEAVASVFHESAEWTEEQRAQVEEDTARRFEAILAVTRSAAPDDDQLLHELADAGGAAAWSGASLPQVLLTFRVSRDLLVQAAIRAAEDLGREWALAVTVVLTKVLPVIDRLSDSVAGGYWTAVLTREQEASARYRHVVEHSSNGVYELGLDGTIRYLNPTMAAMCGGTPSELAGRNLFDLLQPLGGESEDIFLTPSGSAWRSLRAVRIDGSDGEFLVQITARTDQGTTVGFDGIVRDVTMERETERRRTDFLTLITRELRQPVESVRWYSRVLAEHADDLDAEHISEIAAAVEQLVTRLKGLLDEVDDVTHIRESGV